MLSLVARKLLTKQKILELQRIAQKAIYDNAHGDIGNLVEDLTNGHCMFSTTIYRAKIITVQIWEI